MLFDTVKKKKQAEQEEQDWNANRPADYVNQNQAAMDALTGQVGSGYDGATVAKAYQQYRDQATNAAAASADNARATAAALSGGYGSSYADSVAQQNQGAATAGLDEALTGLRSRALNEYQNEQNGILAALSGMGTTEALDRSAYGTNLTNYTNRQNFLANQSAQARNENDNFWNNLWNGVVKAANVAQTAYDGYKGYTYQQEQLDLQKRQQALQEQQWEYNKGRTDKNDALGAYQDAFGLYKQGAGDAAQEALKLYGLNADAFANYTGAPVTRDDQAGVLTTAASLVANGNPEAAGNLLKLYGMDANAAGDYNTLAQRALAEAIAQAKATKAVSGSGSGSGSGRRSTGGSSAGSSFTKSQLMSMAKSFSSMKKSDPLYSYYKQTLEDEGWLTPSEDVGTVSGGMTAPLAQMSYTPTGITLRNQAGNQNTQKNQGLTESRALSYVTGWKNQGLDAETIALRLMNLGATNEVVAKAMRNAGF